MILAGNSLKDSITKDNVLIGVEPKNIGASSVDVRLGNKIYVENNVGKFESSVINLAEKQNIGMREVDITSGYVLNAGEFILASTMEEWNLPNDISTEFKMRSSMARNGLDHVLASWADAGFHGANLTLELKNVTLHHNLYIKAGMRIGQVILHKHEEVPQEQSYATRGRYNGVKGTVTSKGVE